MLRASPLTQSIGASPVSTALAREGHPISVVEFDELPADSSHRLEIEDGRLLVMNRPAGPHIKAAQRLVSHLNDQLPDELEAMLEFQAELVGASPRRIPDVVVCGADACDQVRVRAEQILLAIEIVSPGESAARDYIKKPAEYAANGIPNTWVIDIQENPLSLTVYTLDDTGQYHFTSPMTGRYTGAIGGHEVTIDLDALTGPRRKRN
ncbi:Uma2 family endonuclease [Kutzneria buriramensis]|uniref:Uma2 family endonuclease n=1 Tax=Kutzneria buriramensis TaxID=1045776 RepID=A0A3E0HL79_9PSEU|nr:Uma2 family endonuclease [Kutzneria buriramensis]REH47242.1 Uma2 family endonuclease [Kutzneria buriramensis]